MDTIEKQRGAILYDILLMAKELLRSGFLLYKLHTSLLLLLPFDFDTLNTNDSE
jgi:hypothetical protein